MIGFRIKVSVWSWHRDLRDVPIQRNPHNLGGYDGHTCFYHCDDYSTVGEIQDDDIEFEFSVQSEHPDPVWGEKVTLLSTSSRIQQEPWGMNEPNIFIFWRDMYWLVDEFTPHQEYGHRGYPGVDRRAIESLNNGLYNFRPWNANVPEPEPWPWVGRNIIIEHDVPDEIIVDNRHVWNVLPNNNIVMNLEVDNSLKGQLKRDFDDWCGFIGEDFGDINE